MEDIKGETVDYTTDSNNDGISDYYTKKIVEGKLTYGTGVKLIFDDASYEEIQANDDYDGDGLKNSEEIEPYTDYHGKVFIKYYSNPANPDTDEDSYNDYEDLNPNVPYKNPVILIHGRKDNSAKCFGIVNGISENLNSGYGYEDTAVFSSVENQKIKTNEENTITLNESIAKDGSIAKKLVDNGYTPNGNLFAFNYPNEDMTYINAMILAEYIQNLINAQCVNSIYTSSFFATKQDKENQFVQFDIVAHSNGGLVSRYYIENLEGDYYIRKLITIDTPHYGSKLAMIGSNTDFLNCTYIVCPMDFDLSADSRLFTGNIKTYLSLFNILNKLAIYYFNKSVNYALNHQSPKLNGNHNVRTTYYAIGGIDYDYNVTNKPIAVEFIRHLDSVYIFLTLLIGKTYQDYNVDISGLSSDSGDNIIDIMTQFGMCVDDNDIIEYIHFRGTTVIINGSNEYSLISGNYWHTAVLWDNSTCKTVLYYLNGEII